MAKLKLLRYAPLTKCSFTTVNTAFVLVASLEFRVFRGLNEYRAGMWLPKDNWTGDSFSFVDEYIWECSRDIDPNKGWGDKGDVYYL